MNVRGVADEEREQQEKALLERFFKNLDDVKRLLESTRATKALLGSHPAAMRVDPIDTLTEAVATLYGVVLFMMPGIGTKASEEPRT